VLVVQDSRNPFTQLLLRNDQGVSGGSRG
jgi:hypothetical protein